MSQDSFAGTLPQDIADKKYMKETLAFQVPLSKLDQTQASVIEMHSEDEGLSPSFASDMYASLPPNQGVRTSRTRFRDISGSQTSSQSRFEASQDQLSQSQFLSDSLPEGQGHAFDEGSNLPPDMSTELHFDCTQSTQPATQPEDQGPTQPTDETAPIGSYYPQSAATSTTNGPRSILSMVNPRKRWRFQGNNAAFAQAEINYRMAETQFSEELQVGSSAYEETQVSEASHMSCVGQVVGGLAQDDEDPSEYLETQPSTASNLPPVGHVPGEEEDDDTGRSECLETQPSTASHLPPTGHIVESDDAEGATQPSTASNLPATGVVADPSTSNQHIKTHPPRYARRNSSDMNVVPGSEASQLLQRVNPTSSPIIPDPVVLPSDMEGSDTDMAGSRQSPEADIVPTSSPDIPLAVTNPSSSKPLSKPLRREALETIMPPPRKRSRTDAYDAFPASFPAPVPPLIFRTLRSERGIIPSSDPQERLEAAAEAAETAAEASRAPRSKSKKSSPTKVPVTPVRSKVQLHDDWDGEDDSSSEEPDDECDKDFVPEDMRTEVAEEEADDVPGPPTTGRKRKRVLSSVLRSSTRSIRSTTHTPPVRGNRRLKSASIAQTIVVPATRVFAFWKRDCHYYVGTVYSESDTSSEKYRIHFDDNLEDDVDLANLRRLELRVGDYVMVQSTPRPLKAEVIDASRCESERKVLVRLDDDEEIEIETKVILIPSRSIVSRWGDRMITAEEIVIAVRPKVKSSPTPSKLAEANGCPRSTRKIFAKTGFVTTSSPSHKNTGEENRRLQTDIQTSGGVIFEDWCHVFDMDGTTSSNHKQWVLEKSEVKLLRPELNRVFLLADDACHKPKFLLALALGIPCVRYDWLFDSVKVVSISVVPG
jgi:hypothetical protein